MNIGIELRRLVFGSENGVYERRNGTYQLMARAIEDAPDEIGFTLSEAGARGWTPVVAGRIARSGALTITFCSAQSSEPGLALLSTLLEQEILPANVTPLPEPAAPSAPTLSELELVG